MHYIVVGDINLNVEEKMKYFRNILDCIPGIWFILHLIAASKQVKGAAKLLSEEDVSHESHAKTNLDGALVIAIHCLSIGDRSGFDRLFRRGENGGHRNML